MNCYKLFKLAIKIKKKLNEILYTIQCYKKNKLNKNIAWFENKT